MLAAALAFIGIDYRHEPDLGGRRLSRPDSVNQGLRNESLRGYADHMGTDPFERALGRLVDLAIAEPTAILCSEALPLRCHRFLISDALVVAGFEVVHILGPGETQPHAMHSEARVERDRSIVYG